MAGKTYRAAARTDPIWFGLVDGDGNDVRFDCVDEIPGGLVLDMSDMDNITGAAAKKQVDEFFGAALSADDFIRFQEMIRDPKCRIGVPMLVEILGDLMEQYTARENPTSEASPTTSPRTPSGGNLTGGVSPTQLTYSRLEPVGPSA